MSALAVPALVRPLTAERRRALAGRLRWPAALLEGLLAGIVAAVLAGSFLPPLVGHRILSVLSGSMEPTIGTGDAIVVRNIAPRDMRIGDIVTFRDPDDQSRMMTHRVRGLDVRDGSVHVITKGDANTGVERWSVPLGGKVGLVRSRLPGIGRAFVWSRTAPGRLLLLVVPAGLLCLLALRRVWRSEPGRQALAAAAALRPRVQAARPAVSRRGRRVTVTTPPAEPGDRLSAVAVLGDGDVAFIAPLGWALIDDRRTATGRLLRYERLADADTEAEHTFRSSYETSISVSIVAYGAQTP